MPPSTHQSLLLAMNDGSRRNEAWIAFHERYRDVIMQWCNKRGLQHASAEDMTQEILLKLFERLPLYDPEKGAFRKWLKAVVHNALADKRRKENSRPKEDAFGASDFQQWLNNVPDQHAADEISTAIEQRGEEVENEIFTRIRKRVSENSWQAFYQMIVENRKASDVAKDLGIQPDSVYKAVYRVKKMVSQEYLRTHNMEASQGA